MRQLFSSIPGQVLDFMVVLIGLVIIFKTRITGVVNDIFEKIVSQSSSV